MERFAYHNADEIEELLNHVFTDGEKNLEGSLSDNDNNYHQKEDYINTFSDQIYKKIDTFEKMVKANMKDIIDNMNDDSDSNYSLHINQEMARDKALANMYELMESGTPEMKFKVSKYMLDKIDGTPVSEVDKALANRTNSPENVRKINVLNVQEADYEELDIGITTDESIKALEQEDMNDGKKEE